MERFERSVVFFSRIYLASDLKCEDGNNVIYCRTWKSKVLEEVDEVLKD